MTDLWIIIILHEIMVNDWLMNNNDTWNNVKWLTYE